ncbi:MAG TPA: hypothetical protein VM123_05355 [archaeon]|nr:hypothetical protein [archaeon]
MAERKMQEIELDIEKSREIITGLKAKLIQRRQALRELIEQLRIIKTKLKIQESSSANLDIEVENTKLTSEIKTLLILSNEDKIRIIAEKKRVEEKKEDLPIVTQESEQLYSSWEGLRKELQQVENNFRHLDEVAFKRLSESFIKKKTAESKLDPEREIINLLLLLNNKRGLLYVRKKEAAKDPTTDSLQLLDKYETDIKKLESQLITKSRSYGITTKRLSELKNLFLK